jgi:hypothetical protein
MFNVLQMILQSENALLNVQVHLVHLHNEEINPAQVGGPIKIGRESSATNGNTGDNNWERRNGRDLLEKCWTVKQFMIRVKASSIKRSLPGGQFIRNEHFSTCFPLKE